MAEQKKGTECASTEKVFNYFVENAGPIYDHAVLVFDGMQRTYGEKINKQTVSGLSTHLSMLCQMVIVAVAESVHTGKDPNQALDALNQFILSYIPDDLPENVEDKQTAENLVGLLFDKAGRT